MVEVAVYDALRKMVNSEIEEEKLLLTLTYCATSNKLCENL